MSAETIHHEEPQAPTHETLSQISVNEVKVMGNRGPCGGVNMAIEVMHEVLLKVDGREPVYTTNPIVHYPEVMQGFEEMGLRLVSSIDDIPDGAITTLSAHGNTPEDKQKLEEKGCPTVDTTCQLVTRVQNLARRAVREGNVVPYVGSRKKDGELHPETRSVLSHAEDEIQRLKDEGREHGIIIPIFEEADLDHVELKPGQVAELHAQTTFSKAEFADIKFRAQEKWGEQFDASRQSGICMATDNRQDAVTFYGSDDSIDGFIVVGDINLSHNTKELAHLAETFKPTLALATELDLDESMFGSDSNLRTLALTAGASVPDSYAPIRILNWFAKRGATITYESQLIDEKTAAFKKPLEDLANLDAHLLRKYE